MNDKDIEYDKCVVCEDITDEPVDRHISYRKNYIEGAGQLCNKCALRLL